MILYAATSNQGKLAEFAKSACGAGVEVLALPALKEMPEPVEDATTFMGNAEKKAIAYSLLARNSEGRGLLVFADDSGIEADALGGQPGVRSARFADYLNFEPGQGTKDERNNRCLLSLLVAVPNASRGGRFVCALALARDGEVLLRAEGVCEGEILTEPRGENGFGYDPLFLLPSLGLTTAELDPATKWQLSHRGNAFRALLDELNRSSL
jgi:XTP/dITP diphosphohydrolase